MKEKIENEIKRLIIARDRIYNDLELSLIDISAEKEAIFIHGKIKALEWCLELFE